MTPAQKGAAQLILGLVDLVAVFGLALVGAVQVFGPLAFALVGGLVLANAFGAYFWMGTTSAQPQAVGARRRGRQ